jgi:hypothetical protein
MAGAPGNSFLRTRLVSIGSMRQRRVVGPNVQLGARLMLEHIAGSISPARRCTAASAFRSRTNRALSNTARKRAIKADLAR